jgi:hypothetical protein
VPKGLVDISAAAVQFRFKVWAPARSEQEVQSTVQVHLHFAEPIRMNLNLSEPMQILASNLSVLTILTLFFRFIYHNGASLMHHEVAWHFNYCFITVALSGDAILLSMVLHNNIE